MDDDQTTDQRPIWAKLPDESFRSFAAFTLYRDLGPGRSLAKTREHHLGRNGGSKRASVPGRWRTWSVQHRWPERAAAWDEHVAVMFLQEHERLIRGAAGDLARRQAEIRTEEARVGQALIERGRQMLRFPISTAITTTDPDGRTVTTITPTRWSLADACRALELGDRLIRMASGLD